MHTPEFICGIVRERMEKYASRRYIGSDLAGLCGLASTIVAESFCRNGHTPVELHYGDYGWCGHCWVVFNKHIYDVTATQFRIPHKVYIVPVGSKEGVQYKSTHNIDMKQWAKY